MYPVKKFEGVSWTGSRTLLSSGVIAVSLAVVLFGIFGAIAGSESSQRTQSTIAPVHAALQSGIYLTVSCPNEDMSWDGTSICDDQSNIQVGFGPATGNDIQQEMTTVPAAGYGFSSYSTTASCLGYDTDMTCHTSTTNQTTYLYAYCGAGDVCSSGSVTETSVPVVTSDHWAGYVVTATNGTLTESRGSWILPSVYCTGEDHGDSDQSVAFWSGIDGYSAGSPDLIQAGVVGTCTPSPFGDSTSYTAWYEAYPAGAVTISSIHPWPGDKFAVNISYKSSNSSFKLTVTNDSQTPFVKWIPFTDPQLGSAECIVEDPSAGSGLSAFAEFNPVEYGNHYTSKIGCAATISGTTKTFGKWSNYYAIEMVDSVGDSMVTVTPLTTDGSSFIATWQDST